MTLIKAEKRVVVGEQVEIGEHLHQVQLGSGLFEKGKRGHHPLVELILMMKMTKIIMMHTITMMMVMFKPTSKNKSMPNTSHPRQQHQWLVNSYHPQHDRLQRLSHPCHRRIVTSDSRSSFVIWNGTNVCYENQDVILTKLVRRRMRGMLNMGMVKKNTSFTKIMRMKKKIACSRTRAFNSVRLEKEMAWRSLFLSSPLTMLRKMPPPIA
mmetsp:Transcript_9982/g.16387  ORF Transcript_9982/g.16387 Transcript_9982/m.16387 type:complete len:210 (-) Transcript_9982:2385-3014(-)